MANRFGEMKNTANIGDLIVVAGYGNKTFQVEGFTHEVEYNPDSIYESILYDVTDLVTMDFLIAFQDDISVVSKADKADEYLKENKPKTDLSKLTVSINITETPEEDTETVDDLLILLSDTLTLQRMFGDHEDDEKEDRKIALKVCEIKAKLQEQAEKGVD